MVSPSTSVTTNLTSNQTGMSMWQCTILMLARDGFLNGGLAAIAGRPRQGPELEHKFIANASMLYVLFGRKKKGGKKASYEDRLHVNDFWKEVRALLIVSLLYMYWS